MNKNNSNKKLSKHPKIKKHIMLFSDRNIAIFALIISFCSFLYPMIKDLIENKENLSICFNAAFFDDNIEYSYLPQDEYLLCGVKSYIDENFEFVLSNTSNKPISITKFVIDTINNNAQQTINSKNNYKFFIDNEQIGLPFFIEANKSILIKVTYHIGLKCKQDATIQSINSYKKQVSIKDINAILLSNSIDIWGNKVKQVIQGKYLPIGSFYIPKYTVTITTAKKNTYTCNFSQFANYSDLIKSYVLN